jgi:hypothetical protein
MCRIDDIALWHVVSATDKIFKEGEVSFTPIHSGRTFPPLPTPLQ